MPIREFPLVQVISRRSKLVLLEVIPREILAIIVLLQGINKRLITILNLQTKQNTSTDVLVSGFEQVFVNKKKERTYYLLVEEAVVTDFKNVFLPHLTNLYTSFNIFRAVEGLSVGPV